MFFGILYFIGCVLNVFLLSCFLDGKTTFRGKTLGEILGYTAIAFLIIASSLIASAILICMDIIEDEEDRVFPFTEKLEEYVDVFVEKYLAIINYIPFK